MAAAVFDALWFMGVAVSLGLLCYGAYLVYVFTSNASETIKRAVARLALHDSGPRGPIVEAEKILP